MFFSSWRKISTINLPLLVKSLRKCNKLLKTSWCKIKLTKKTMMRLSAVMRTIWILSHTNSSRRESERSMVGRLSHNKLISTANPMRLLSLFWNRSSLINDARSSYRVYLTWTQRLFATLSRITCLLKIMRNCLLGQLQLEISPIRLLWATSISIWILKCLQMMI